MLKEYQEITNYRISETLKGLGMYVYTRTVAEEEWLLIKTGRSWKSSNTALLYIGKWYTKKKII